MHGTAEVVTWRRRTAARTYAGWVPTRPGRPTRCATGVGVTGDERVATFMWNNDEHLVAYFAVPSMGAVLHTLNLRLFPPGS